MTDAAIAQAATLAAANAQSELERIFQEVVESNGLTKIPINHVAMTKIGMALHELEHRSFTLGLKTGVALMVELSQKSQELP